MKNFIVYDALTGSIKRVGHVPDDAFNLQAEEGESILEGIADPANQKVDLATESLVNIIIPSPPDEVMLEQLRAYKAEIIERNCWLAIVSGYRSDALGTNHLYPSKERDQGNMVASVTDSYNPENPVDWTTPFWCADESGQWDFREHTATQIRRAGAVGKAYVVLCQRTNEQLQELIQAAITFQELEAIAWPTD